MNAVPVVPGCAPQVPVHERPLNTTVNPENSWAAAMALATPQAGVPTEHHQPKVKVKQP